MHAYGLAGDFANMERHGRNLTALCRLPKTEGNRAIALIEANASRRSAFLYGKAGQIDDADRWSRHLIQQVHSSEFKEEIDFKTEIGKAAVNAIVDFGNADRPVDVRFWADQIVSCIQTASEKDDPELRMVEARGCVNAVVAFRRIDDLANLQFWAARMIAIADDPLFRANQDFRIEEANCARNILLALEHTDDDFLPFRQLWRKRLAKVAREFPGSSEIQSQANAFDLTYAAQAANGWPYGPPLH